jgi:methyltransferase (TIGR00027 family)
MKENKASFTAMMVAYMRAYHAMHDAPKIFDDFLAYYLIPEDKRKQIEEYLTCWYKQLTDTEHIELSSDQTTTTTSYMPVSNKGTIEQKWTTQLFCRAKYAEETLEKAVLHGVKQYIILGAGLDTFAFRRPDLMEKLEVYEVDHPATQVFKLNRIAELGWKIPAKLHFIPIDFTKESLATALTQSPDYDPTLKTFFSWLGVTYFLTRDEVFATLQSIAQVATSGSMVVFDYFDNEIFNPEKSSLRMEKTLEFLQNIEEPMKTGFNPSTLAEDLSRLGFSLKENLSPADIEIRYLQGRTDEYHAADYVYFACAIVK